MEQLPGSDAVFLAMETDTVYGHIGGLTILDPTDAPRFDFARDLYQKLFPNASWFRMLVGGFE